jgi:hypothetical protein
VTLTEATNAADKRSVVPVLMSFARRVIKIANTANQKKVTIGSSKMYSKKKNISAKNFTIEGICHTVLY